MAGTHGVAYQERVGIYPQGRSAVKVYVSFNWSRATSVNL
jgi:hypothetical protein